jgi:hypothetical protein
MRTVLLALSLSLAGCAASIIAATPRSVTIDAMDLGSATPLAQAECQKHGRHARFIGKTEARYMSGYAFDCVL